MKNKTTKDEYSNEELNINREELREEKADLIHQQHLQQAPRGRDGDTSTSTSKQVVSSIASLMESSEGAVSKRLKEVSLCNPNILDEDPGYQHNLCLDALALAR